MFDSVKDIVGGPHDVLDAALDLTDRGIRIFPVLLIREGEKVIKRPAITDWRQGASLDPKRIHAWFSAGKYVIGVPTGAYNDLTVVDVDPRHGGDTWYAQQQLPPTRRHDTL